MIERYHLAFNISYSVTGSFRSDLIDGLLYLESQGDNIPTCARVQTTLCTASERDRTKGLSKLAARVGKARFAKSRRFTSQVLVALVYHNSRSLR
jgi:hypothetical protein